MKVNKLYAFILLAILYMLPSNDLKAQYMLDSTYVDTAVILSGLDIPWEMKLGPDGYVYMTERYGRVSRFHPDTPGVQHVIADLTGVVRQEGAAGLLGIELHPDFLDTSYVYLIYNYDVDSATLYMNQRIVRYEFDGSSLINPTTLVDSIGGSIFVSGSRMIIGPDRKLYLTTGCTQDFSEAQNFQSMSGKVLRLNLDGSIPSDNPFPGNPLYSLGHRNPQGLDYHNGIWYSAEHGPHNDDEINVIEAGRNYGWPEVNGYCDMPAEIQFCADSNMKEPLHSYITTIGISEVKFYDGAAIPEFENSLLQLSLKNQRIYHVKLDSSRTQALYQKEYFHYEFGRLRDILLLPDGRILIAGQPPQNNPFNHFIFALIPSGQPACQTPENNSVAVSNDTITFNWDAVAGATQYEIRVKQLPVGNYQSFFFGSGDTSATFPFVPQGYYGWQIMAYCGQDRSPASVMEIFEVGAVAPPSNCPIPDPPFTNAVTKTSAQLNWDPVEDVQTHVVRGGIAGTNVNTWLYLGTNSNSNSYVASGLKPGTSYQWQVQAVCDSVAGDTSNWSIVGAFSTFICDDPAPIASTVTSSSNATLNWTAVPNAVYYEIWGKNTAVSNIVKLKLPASMTSYNISGLAPQNTYVWSIFTQCDSTFTEISNFVSPIDTFTTPPSATQKQVQVDELITENSFSILPNPNNGLFTVSVNSFESSDVKLTVFNSLGEMVYREKFANGIQNQTIDLQDLSKGVYILNIGNEDYMNKQKIVIQ